MGSTIAMLRQCETCKQVKSVTQMFTRIGKTNNYYAVCKACRA